MDRIPDAASQRQARRPTGLTARDLFDWKAVSGHSRYRQMREMAKGALTPDRRALLATSIEKLSVLPEAKKQWEGMRATATVPLSDAVAWARAEIELRRPLGLDGEPGGGRDPGCGRFTRGAIQRRAPLQQALTSAEIDAILPGPLLAGERGSLVASLGLPGDAVAGRPVESLRGGCSPTLTTVGLSPLRLLLGGWKVSRSGPIGSRLPPTAAQFSH